jgi:hypothetical protein
LRADMRRQANRDVHGDKLRLFGRRENVCECRGYANTDAVVPGPRERGDPPGPAAVNSRNPCHVALPPRLGLRARMAFLDYLRRVD